MRPGRALRVVRGIRDERGGASAMDVAYAVYAGALVVLIVGFPLLRAVVLELAEPAAAAALRAHGPTATAAAWGIAATALLAAGGARGPALLSPFLASALGGSALPRAVVLRRPTAQAFVGWAALGALVAVLPAIALLIAGDADPVPVVAFAAGGALAGVAVAGCWLLGQRLGPGARAAVGAVLLGSTGLGLLAHAPVAPWGALAALFPGPVAGSPGPATGSAGLPAGSVAALGVLVALAVVAVAAAPLLLRGLRGPDLVAQARRWEAATTLATTGDLAMAAGGFRPVPRVGRGLAAVGGRSLPALILRRDVVGSLRTPVRVAAAAIGIATSGGLVAAAVGGDGVGRWGPGVAAALVGFLALGVWADGFRHVVDVSSAPPLYGIPTGRLLALHAILPAAAGVVGALAGAGVAVAQGADPAGLPAAPGVALLLVAVRAFDAAKGPLPLEVMAPVATPAGDASALVVAAWQADALLLAGGSTLAVVAATASVGPLGAAVALPIAAGIAYRARRRIATARD
ncbi:hypothetical protein [Clavibacter tessellarius]|uniref:Uncharacterized protein n=1 Tax=Clavibacter tessellarius TaxID=31965 RepID=A0A154UYV6_9MICO|nr:hypothetical protein [Clavibacter michiganensis]KZC94266.1 hypothetical protein AWH51_14535 [Clavibacter michiganensis subsp. tessellarius]